MIIKAPEILSGNILNGKQERARRSGVSVLPVLSKC